ncbi:uncharacterized protein LOC121417437 [Lytechinus variegatus]|uniref:uncharacterized protein LOC121417437 n=1 Tax=Lytechinus variegatus TaxID=7654 RepID=UPI001BB17624|nr:uncharacterized protein LOC121417437 [Lytechinus variegatus]
MSEYVSRHVIRSCKCTQCSLALHRNAPNSLHLTGIGSFTERKDRGGLVKPRTDVYEIIKCTDKILSLFMRSHFSLFIRKNRNTLCANSNPMKVSKDVLHGIQQNVIESVRHKVFRDLEQHFYDQYLEDEDDHCVQLIKHISSLYIKTITHHHGRLFTRRYVNNNQPSRRHKLTKTIVFLGQ